MFNEQDDTDEWLKQQAAQASVMQPDASPGPWAKARELMQRQAGMQYQAPERFSQPIKAEAAPKSNDWGTVAAMVLNLLGNKGKDLGNIAMQATEQRNKQLADWRRENSPSALQARELQQMQLRNADRQGFEADRQALGQQAAQEMQIANAEQGEERFQAQQIQHAAEHEDQVNYQNRSLEQQAADSSARLTQADRFHTDSQQLARAQMAQSAGQAAASRAQALKLHEDQMGFNRDKLSQDAEHDKALMAATAQREAAAAAEKQRAAAASFGEQTEDLRRMIPGLNTMSTIMSNPNYKNDLPGVGPLDSDADPSTGLWGKTKAKLAEAGKSPEWKRDNAAMRQARKDILEFDLRKLTGAGAPEAEKAQEMLRQGGTDEASVRQAVNTFNNALKLEFQSRAQNGNMQIVSEALAPYGWDWQSPVGGENSGGTALQPTQPTQPDALGGIPGLKKRR